MYFIVAGVALWPVAIFLGYLLAFTFVQKLHRNLLWGLPPAFAVVLGSVICTRLYDAMASREISLKWSHLVEADDPLLFWIAVVGGGLFALMCVGAGFFSLRYPRLWAGPAAHRRRLQQERELGA